MSAFQRMREILIDNKPANMTAEEWEYMKAERRAAEERRNTLRREAVKHFTESEDYKRAGIFKRFRMKFYYRVWLDKSGTLDLHGAEEIDDIFAIIDAEAQALAKLTREQRIKYFERTDRLNNMNFVMDFDSTVLHVSTKFDGNSDETIADTVYRVVNTTK